MQLTQSLIVAGGLVATATAVVARSPPYSLYKTIPWNVQAPDKVDQAVIYDSTYYVVDELTVGVQVLDLKTFTPKTFIHGFTQVTVNGTVDKAISGPAGQCVAANRKELYVGDGQASFKVVDLTTNKIIGNVSTGLTTHVDEIGYNPYTQIAISTSPDEDIPTVGVHDMKTRKTIGLIQFPGTFVDIEQPTWNPADQKFYVSVPTTDDYPDGAVAVLDVVNMKVEKWIHNPKCYNAGIAFSTKRPNHLFTGCSRTQLDVFGFASSYVLDVATGVQIHNISGVSGNDQVTYSSYTDYWYGAGFQEHLANGTVTPRMNVVSGHGTLLQAIPSYSISQNVAVDDSDGTLIIAGPNGAEAWKYTGHHVEKRSVEWSA